MICMIEFVICNAMVPQAKFGHFMADSIGLTSLSQDDQTVFSQLKLKTNFFNQDRHGQ